MVNRRQLGGDNDPSITVEANQHPDCFTIRSANKNPEDSGYPDEDLIHFCDWPAMKAAIDAFQKTRGGRT